jgi:hypothetical protein
MDWKQRRLDRLEVEAQRRAWKGIKMVVKVSKSGTRIHSPPYTKAEENELCRRMGGGPITVARPAGERKAPESPKQQQPSPAKPRRS